MSVVGLKMVWLASQSGLSERTLRAWIRLGILPSAHGKFRGATYDESHLLRARVAKNLREQGVSLKAIRQRMFALSEEQLRTLLPQARPSDALGVPLPPPAPSYPASSWEFVPLMTGLSLLVSADSDPLPKRVADEIYRHYAVHSASAAR